MMNNRRTDRRNGSGKRAGSQGMGIKGALLSVGIILILRSNCIFCNNQYL